MHPALLSFVKVAAQSLEAQLRPGDIVLMSPKPVPTTISTVPAAALKAFTLVSKDLQGEKTHSAIYVGNGDIVEARIESGVTRKRLRDALKDVSATVVRPAVDEAQRRLAARRALELHRQGLRYDVAGLARAFAHAVGIPTREKKTLDAVTCSTLIANAYKVPLVTKPKDSVIPSDFLGTGEHVLEVKHAARR